MTQQTVPVQERTLFGHPLALFVLFFCELWERFSFYGMRALLVFYMTKQLMYTDSKAYEIYGSYGSLVYATPVIGGLLADRILGYRRAIVLGGVLMAVGHFAMAIENETAFFAALALLIVGNGFFKPNISSLVGKLYPEKDPRRDNAFTIFYMGINLGAFLAPLTCGIIGEGIGWHWGFGLAGLGMVLGLVIFLAAQGLLGEHGLPPVERPRPGGIDSGAVVAVVATLSVPAFMFLVQAHEVLGVALIGLGLTVLASLLYIAFTSPKPERERMFVVIILIFSSILFWAFFEQAGTSINLFTDRNVDRSLPLVVDGWYQGIKPMMPQIVLTQMPPDLVSIPASAFQSLNPMFIVLFGPVFAALWSTLGARNLEPSTPMKFALGLAQLGLGFAILVLGASLAQASGMTNVWFLVFGYLLHTTGELCTSPVGLSMVTKLSPPKSVGLVMGAWFLSSSFAHFAASAIAQLTGGEEKTGTAIAEAHAAAGSLGGFSGFGTAVSSTVSAIGTNLSGILGQSNLPPEISLGLYSSVFWSIALVAFAAAAISMVFVPIMKKWMHGIN